jgi:predicted CoA-binding protein
MANEHGQSNWERIKSFFWNAIVGAIIISIVGFSWLGWVTGGTAQQEAKKMSEEAVNDRLAKICVYQAIQDPGKDLKLKELKEKSSYEIDDYVMKQGWATMPGEEAPERVVADKCAKLLLDISQ